MKTGIIEKNRQFFAFFFILSSNSSFSDQEPNKKSDFPPTYEKAVLEF